MELWLIWRNRILNVFVWLCWGQAERERRDLRSREPKARHGRREVFGNEHHCFVGAIYQGNWGGKRDMGIKGLL